MKQPIPSNGTERLKAGDRVQIVPEWQDPGDDQFKCFVIEAPDDCTMSDASDPLLLPPITHNK